MAYKGIKLTTLETKVQERGNKSSIALAVLRGGISGCGAINGTAAPTHTWSLSEEGGVLKIGKLKYVGSIKAEKSAKAAK